MPISPFASTARPQATQPASSQRNCGLPGSSARAIDSVATANMPATSMSWLAYCAPTKKNGLVANASKPMPAVRDPCQRRKASHIAAPISQAPSVGPRRTAKWPTPKIAMPSMSTQ